MIKFITPALILILGLPTLSLAQARHQFNIYQARTMSADAAAITIQQPTSGAEREAWIDHVTVECPSATFLQIDVDCSTRATATAAAINSTGPRRHTSYTPTFAAFINSNAASCTTVQRIAVPADTPVSVAYDTLTLPADTSTTNTWNVTFRTGTVTSGTCYLSVWVNQR